MKKTSPSKIQTALSLSFIFSLNAGAAPFIENPSDKLLKQEKEVLSRVLKISSKAAECSATWIDTGVLMTAKHCEEVIDYDPARDHNFVFVARQGDPKAIRAQVVSVISPEAAKNPMEQLMQDLGLVTMGAVNRIDFMVLGIDPKPLRDWSLPTEPLALVTAAAGPLPEGQELLVAGYGLDKPQDFEVKATFTEAGLLFEGLEPLRPQSDEPSKTERFGAAMIKTTQVNQKHYDIQFEAARDLTVRTECRPGQVIVPGFVESCRYFLQFESTKKKDDPMILSGDSGGPAFMKDQDGKWRLLGVTSANSFLPEMKHTIEYSYQWNGKRPVQLKSKASKSVDVSKISYLEGSITNNVLALQQVLKVDPTVPFSAEFISKQKINGRIVGFHVNLRDPQIQNELVKVIPQLKAEVNKFIEPAATN